MIQEAKSIKKAGVIIPAAGFGARMKADRPKQFLYLGEEPILIRTIKSFLDCPAIRSIVLAVARDQQQRAEALLSNHIQTAHRSRITVTHGGTTRQQSVEFGLKKLPGNLEIVLVHDGARPLVSRDLIEDCIAGAQEKGAVLAAVPVNDTLKRVDMNDTVVQTVDRQGLYRAQTPQAVQRHLLDQAYQVAHRDTFTGTDEASLLEHAGIPVSIVSGAEKNLKITRPDDLEIARHFLGEEQMIRIGHGFDAHRLVEGRPLILGGEALASPLGLLGHSDADVLTHAFIDALLGAMGLGDIGQHFPDTKKKYAGISSLRLLEETWALAVEQGYTLGNADLTILCQQPKLAPYLEKMRQNLAAICAAPVCTVNIKATTTEQMGYTGRGEGIAAHAVVLLTRRKDR